MTAMRVEHMVMRTESATFALARKQTTLLAVPPGQQETRMMPSFSSGGRAKSVAMVQPMNGMMRNWARMPMKMARGVLRISLKLSNVRVIPMPSMMMPSPMDRRRMSVPRMETLLFTNHVMEGG